MYIYIYMYVHVCGVCVCVYVCKNYVFLRLFNLKSMLRFKRDCTCYLYERLSLLQCEPGRHDKASHLTILKPSCSTTLSTSMKT